MATDMWSASIKASTQGCIQLSNHGNDMSYLVYWVGVWRLGCGGVVEETEKVEQRAVSGNGIKVIQKKGKQAPLLHWNKRQGILFIKISASSLSKSTQSINRSIRCSLSIKSWRMSISETRISPDIVIRYYPCREPSKLNISRCSMLWMNSLVRSHNRERSRVGRLTLSSETTPSSTTKKSSVNVIK